jgi:voltage-gated potassium channel
MELFDSFYMTLITISTVGFSEIKPLSVAGRIITIFIIIAGISLLTYTLGQIATIFVEGELRRILGRRKLEKIITKLRDHYIVCAFGRIDETIFWELREGNIPLVVIEQDETQREALEAAGFLHLSLDAATEEALLAAGLMRAKGLLTVVSSDAKNVFIALSARGLNPDIFILARASESSSESKLLRAGANRVVSPYHIGGKRMAEILIKATVVDVLDMAMINSELGLEMEEALISSTSTLVGKSTIDSNLRQDFGVIIIAIKQASGRMVFNPSADQVLSGGDVLVAIGKRDYLRSMVTAIGWVPCGYFNKRYLIKIVKITTFFQHQ